MTRSGNINRSFFCLIIGVGLMLFAHSASAQVAAGAKARPDNAGDTPKKSAVKAEAERLQNERKLQARSLLLSLAGNARSFRDQPLRVRCLAKIADVLWEVNVEQGRALFREAWEAAEIADRESQEINLRRQVLILAGKRDRLLGEEFLEKLKPAQPDTTTEPSKPDLWQLSDALEQRLLLAERLLLTGDIERALQFADPVLSSVTISTLDFLTGLREHKPDAADQRYAAMLANTNGNPLADANTVSLLSSYIFTPHLYVTFNTQGGADSAWRSSPVAPANVAPQLRLAFFQTASRVLLRFQPLPEHDQSTSGIVGKYMVFKRLMPLFEQFAPRAITEAMRRQFEVLNTLVSDEVRQRENEWVQKGISPDKPLADQEQSLLDKISHAKTSEERDELYFKLALLALNRDDLKARDFVSKIEESGFRNRAQAWVDWGLAIGFIKKKAVETALELTRKGELTHIQRVWVLTQAAKLLAKSNHEKALSLLDDATAEVRRIDGSDLDRPRGFLAIANALALLEPPRVWDTIVDVVKAANATEGFTGEASALTTNMNSKSQILQRTEAVPDFDIKGVFGKIANKDYDRAIQLASGFQGDAPRANATIAIARSVLSGTGAPAPTPRPVPKQ